MNFWDNPNPGYPSVDVLGYTTYKFKDDIVATQCGDDSRDVIKKYASNIQNGIIVEIGVLGGATLLHLCEDAKKQNNVIYGIDPFDKINVYNGVSKDDTAENVKTSTRDRYEQNRVVLQNIIEKYSLDIKIFHGFSQDAVILFADASINLLHIDGDHSTDGVYRDLINYYPKMAKNGIIIGDDFAWKAVRDGLDKFCKEKGLMYTNNGIKFFIRV